MDLLNSIWLVITILSLSLAMCAIYIYKKNKSCNKLLNDYVILHTKYEDAQKYIEHLNKQNNILQAQALTDHSTGLWNRRHLDNILANETVRMLRLKSDSLKLLMIDIDNYKEVNDSLGHKFGDLLAIEFANLLKKIFRFSDYIFRIGGDEYAVLIRDAGDKTLEIAIRRVRKEIKKIIINCKDVGSLIDISIGSSSFDHNNRGKDMIHEADIKMYEEKRAKKVSA